MCTVVEVHVIAVIYTMHHITVPIIVNNLILLKELRCKYLGLFQDLIF